MQDLTHYTIRMCISIRPHIINIVTTLSYICTWCIAQIHQHVLNNVERPISKDVDKMESTLLSLDVENHLIIIPIVRLVGVLMVISWSMVVQHLLSVRP